MRLKVPTPSSLRRLAACGLAGLGLVGCAELPRPFDPPPVDPGSPIAPLAEAAARANYPMPSFRDLPPQAPAVPTPATIKTDVVEEAAARLALEDYWRAHPPEAEDPETFAKTQRARIPAAEAAPPPASRDAEAEAFAKRLREAAGSPP